MPRCASNISINRDNRGSTDDAGAGACAGATGAGAADASGACAGATGAGAAGADAGAADAGAAAADAGAADAGAADNIRINSFISSIVGLVRPSDCSFRISTLLTYLISLCNILIKKFITRGLDMDLRVGT